MEFKSSDERLSTNPSVLNNGNGIDKERKEKIIDMIKDGVAIAEIVKECKTSKHTVLALKKQFEDSQGINLSEWKKKTSATLAEIVNKGSTRLLTEIENIPAGQLPLAIAIMTDKIMALQDAPTVVVEHRLRVKHEDINAMIRGDIIDLPPEKNSIDKSNT